MGDLQGFHETVKAKEAILVRCEEHLCKLQEKFESFFAEIGKVRESELAQLGDHITAKPAGLPPDLRSSLDAARRKAEEAFEAKHAALCEERDGRLHEAERIRSRSIEAEEEIRRKNRALDEEEEALKARNERLLADIEDYNARIVELSRGLGFFLNVFRMRGHQRTKRALLKEQGDVQARVENLRRRWERDEKEYTELEEKLRAEWVEAKTEADAVQTKIDALEASRSRIVLRSTLEAVLFELAPQLQEPTPDDPPCPRCQMPNPAQNHFCRICARRLLADKPDFEGSLLEIAEVNLHHKRFSEGIAACQAIIGLVRGLKTGHQNFAKSVSDMISTQSRYPLAKLQVDVPPASLEYALCFEALEDLVAKDRSLHPKAFAAAIQGLAERDLTEEKIKGYFEAMGEELSRQADRQW